MIKKIARFPLMFLGALLVALGTVQTVQALPNHPGGYLKQAELDRIRQNVAANIQPWAGAWTALQSISPGANWTTGETGVVTNSYDIQNQGHYIWVLTAKWIASGDISYAVAARNGIDQWVNHVTDMTATTTLRTGIGSSQMANAAEILAYGFGGSAGWPAANIAKAKAWFKSVPYKAISGGVASRTGNWGTSAMTGCMAIAIFCDDQAMFDYAVNAYKFGFKDTQDGCCGVTEYIDATGEAMESGRDMGHVQGGISHLVEVAMMAWNQNVNLVPYTNSEGTIGSNGVSYGTSGANRVYLGSEYEAKYNLGGTVSYHPFPICSGQIYYPNGIAARGCWCSPAWEMACHLYRLAGLDPVYSKQVLLVPGYTPETTNGDHVGLGTLLFRWEAPSVSPPPAAPAGLTASGVSSSQINLAWTASSGAATYNVKRGTVSGGPYAVVRTGITTTSFNDTGLASSTTYDYVVTAVNGGGESGNSNQASAATQSAGGGVIQNGIYKIINRNSGLALDVANNGTAPGSNVDQATYTAGNNQRWTVTNVGGNIYSIVGVGSGLSLDVTANSTADGANIEIWTSTGGNNQRWTFTATSGGYYTITSVHSGKLLDVVAVSKNSGANVEQWTSNGGTNQQWILQAP